MTWLISISGHDELTGEEKIAFENEVVAKARGLATNLRDMQGGRIAVATCTTNTTGPVNLLEEDS